MRHELRHGDCWGATGNEDWILEWCGGESSYNFRVVVTPMMDKQTHAWFEYLAQWLAYLDHKLDAIQAKLGTLDEREEDAAKLAALKIHVDDKKSALQKVLDSNKSKP